MWRQHPRALEDSSINPLPVYSCGFLFPSDPSFQGQIITTFLKHSQSSTEPADKGGLTRVHQGGKGRSAPSPHDLHQLHITVRKKTWCPTGLHVEFIQIIWTCLNAIYGSQQPCEGFKCIFSSSLKGMTTEMCKLTYWYEPWLQSNLLFLRSWYLLFIKQRSRVPDTLPALSTYNFLAFFTNSYMSGIIIIPILQVRKLTLRKVGLCSKTQSLSDLSQNSPFSLIYHFSE